ncbi:Probable LRR receptor-like serine/threonine-protein kinase At3g47570 [Linum grandiflorum]
MKQIQIFSILSRVNFLKLLLLPLLLSFNFPCQSNASGSNETDRLALLEFKKSVTNDPDGVLNSWNDSLHFCNWKGITCSQQPQQQRVISLLLPSHNLGGTLSPHVGNLTSLESINLNFNSFTGEIPSIFGNLARLQYLNLSMNLLRGEIPVNLTRCSQLRQIWMVGNRLVGKIPEEIGVLSNLKVLRVSSNNLTGKIPASLGNLSELENFGAPYNNLAGQIPETVGRLSRLSRFVVGINQLTGQVPPSLYNLSSITILTLVYNQFEGRIPEDIGLTLPNLEHYGNSRNLMSGPIPESLCNASRLSDINMNRNMFTGRIPSCLGRLQKLLYFHAGANSLGTNSSNDFEFVTSLSNCSLLEELGVSLNNLGGPLPASVGNLSVQLYQLDLAFNPIKGNIPDGLQNLVKLNKVDLSYNLFTGSIPTYIGKFKDLQGLFIQGNLLTGQIPSSVGNLTKLNQLDVSNNRLEGAIPFSMGKCQQLNLLDVSINRLIGEIPREVFMLSSLSIRLNLSRNSFNGSLGDEIRNLTNLEVLDVSYNNLSGGIPASIGDCKTLKKLYLQENSLNGTIPEAMASLQGIESLDLSRNNFTGGIPIGLQNIAALQKLNFSFNNLQGEVPNKGIFGNSSAISLIGNAMLCGGVENLHLKDCPTEATTKQKRAATIKLTLIIVLVSLSFISLLGLLYFFKIVSATDIEPNAYLLLLIWGSAEYGMGVEVSKEGDVYSYGILILEMFTAKRPTDQMFKDGLNLRDMVQEAIPGRILSVLDPSMELTESGRDCLVSVLEIGVSCAAELSRERMKMGDVARKLVSVRDVYVASTSAPRRRPERG